LTVMVMEPPNVILALMSMMACHRTGHYDLSFFAISGRIALG
jgi:hypothetical protein